MVRLSCFVVALILGTNCFGVRPYSELVDRLESAAENIRGVSTHHFKLLKVAQKISEDPGDPISQDAWVRTVLPEMSSYFGPAYSTPKLLYVKLKELYGAVVGLDWEIRAQLETRAEQLRLDERLSRESGLGDNLAPAGITTCFVVYASLLPHVVRLNNILECEKEPRPFKAEVSRLVDILAIFDDYLYPHEQYLRDYLQVTPGSISFDLETGDPRQPNDMVELDTDKLLKRFHSRIKSAWGRVQLLNLSQLTLNAPYKIELEKELQGIKKDYKMADSYRPTGHDRQHRRVHVPVVEFLRPTTAEVAGIRKTVLGDLTRVFYRLRWGYQCAMDPLGIRFSAEDGEITLTPQEREENLPRIERMFCDAQGASPLLGAAAQIREQVPLEGEERAHHQPKKKKKKKKTKRESDVYEAAGGGGGPAPAEAAGGGGEDADDIFAIVQAEAFALQAECSLQQADKETKESVAGGGGAERPAVPMADVERESSIELATTWLRNMHKHISATDKLRVKRDFLALRIRSLLKQFENPKLMGEEDSLSLLLDTVARLATRLQEEEAQTKSASLRSPSRVAFIDDELLMFMTTPLCYMKDYRLGRIEPLLRELGVNLDKTAEGSRITLKAGSHITCLHLHDKHNGRLDGGRIFSLRKFLLEAGLFSF